MIKINGTEVDLVALLRELESEDLNRLTVSLFGSYEVLSPVNRQVPAPAPLV